MGTGPNPHRWPPGRATPATSQFEPGRDGMLSVIMSTRYKGAGERPSVSAKAGGSGGVSGRACRRRGGPRGDSVETGRSVAARRDLDCATD